MLNLLKLAWKKWMQFGVLMGNFMSAVFLTIFYFSIFALFALPYRLFGKTIQQRAKGSTWIPKKRTVKTLEDFEYEF